MSGTLLAGRATLARSEALETRETRGASPADASDAALLDRARAGDRAAFAELWVRHAAAAGRVARGFTWIDADDLVAESYARILRAVRAGAGPRGAFRPYLYATIRNLARSWGAARRDVAVDDLADRPDESALDDPAVRALDRTLTVRAFRSLPERWQATLWYSEVEGMEPREFASILGMSANAAAALAYRAREGLRRAWLQAHVSDEGVRDDCRWALRHLGDRTRRGLGARDGRRLAEHLAACARCAIVAAEVDDLGSRLAVVLLPLTLGGAAGGGLLGLVAAPAPAVASAGALATLAVAAALAGGAAVATSPVSESPGSSVVVEAPPEPEGATSDPSDPAAAPESPVLPDALDRVAVDSPAAPVGEVLAGVESLLPPLDVRIDGPAAEVGISTVDSVVLEIDLPLLPELVIRRG